VTAGASAAVPVFAAATFGLWLLARPGRDPMWKRACLSALLSAALALAANQLLAHLVWARPRPFTAHPDQVHLFAAGSLDPSFPSDHAAAAFAIAVAVLFYSRRVGLAFVAVAALIAVSRVVEGLHYPSDVVAGAAVGAIAAVVVTRVGRPLVERLADTLAVATDPIVARVGSALVGLRHRG
jgi:undecaprenyl-diphosphatase